jgi:hypothetical protein
MESLQIKSARSDASHRTLPRRLPRDGPLDLQFKNILKFRTFSSEKKT